MYNISRILVAIRRVCGQHAHVCVRMCMMAGKCAEYAVCVVCVAYGKVGRRRPVVDALNCGSGRSNMVKRW